MVKLKAEGIKTICFSTVINSKKVVHYKVNPKAGVIFYDKGDSVTLTGNMSIVEEKNLKTICGRIGLQNIFPTAAKKIRSMQF